MIRSRPAGQRVRLGQDYFRVRPAFWLYWQFACQRQQLFKNRLLGNRQPGPDPILASYRFTNAYRACDRVSQYLLTEVIYDQVRPPIETVWRTLLFKLFNQISSYQALVAGFGSPTLANFDLAGYQNCLDRLQLTGPIYNPAYIMPDPGGSGDRKHHNHLQLLADLRRAGIIKQLAEAGSLSRLYQILLTVPSFGPFLAYQYAIDINYGPDFNYPESELVVPGPGARRGLSRCFGSLPVTGQVDLIRAVCQQADDFFDQLGLDFFHLWGRRLQLIDCQNLFCELDKYCRARQLAAGLKASRPKQKYRPNPDNHRFGLPPAWQLPYRADQPVWLPLKQIAKL